MHFPPDIRLQTGYKATSNANHTKKDKFLYDSNTEERVELFKICVLLVHESFF